MVGRGLRRSGSESLVTFETDQQILCIMGQLDKVGGHFLPGAARPFDQFIREICEPWCASDQACLLLNLLRIEIIFGAWNAPSAPIRLTRDHNGIGAGHRVTRAILGRLPLISGANDSPVLD